MRRRSRINTRLFFLLTFLSLSLLLLVCTSGGRSVSASSEGVAQRSLMSAVQPQMISPADGGSWSGPTPLLGVPVHISLLPDGRLLYWGRDKAFDGWDIGGQSNTYLLDPLYSETGYTVTRTNFTTNLFCSGHTFLPDGRLIVTGGHFRLDSNPSVEGMGEKHINLFDYRTNNWTRVLPEMELGRWYPYNVTLANGETIAIAGTYWTGDFIGTNPPSPRIKLNIEPSIRDLAGGVRTLKDFNGALFPNVQNYSYVSLTPAGKVFIATPSSIPGVSGSNSRLLDPFATNSSGGLGVFTEVANPAHAHINGTSVMYAPGKVLLLGGYNQQVGQLPTSTAEAIDLIASTPTWSQVGAMASGRQYPTATLLPDGKVLVTGGTSCPGSNNLDCGPNGTFGGAVQTPELWNPANPSEWKLMNSTLSGVPRVYHSVALLMPDATVLVGGGGLPVATAENGTDGQPCIGDAQKNFPCKHAGHKDVEFFLPPYFFNSDGTLAKRPAITSTPSSIAYGQTFAVGLGNVDASDIKDVVLIRLPSVTHTYNQDPQRIVLPHSGTGDWISVTGPANGNACPPGPYMMFLIRNNGRGTPSIAKIIRVGDFSINSTSKAFPATADQGSLSGTISVTAASNVNWVAEVSSGSSSWVTINSGSSGNGNGTVSFSVSPNTAAGAARREGLITIRVPGRDSLGFDFIVYQSSNFTDIVYPPAPNPNGFHSFISKIYARGITAGCGSGAFCPDASLTRGQAAVFLTLTLAPPTLPDPLTQRFGDVPNNHSFRKFIEYIARRGITAGCGGGNFCPDATLTRKQMAVWLMIALGVTNPPTPTFQRFNDVPLSDPAAPFIEEMARRGITAGCGGGNFCPDSSLTRGQMAVFLVLTFGL